MTAEELAKHYLETSSGKLLSQRHKHLVELFSNYEEQIRLLERENYFLRLYGNKDCTAMANDEMAKVMVEE